MELSCCAPPCRFFDNAVCLAVPEEINRIVTDHTASLLFTTEPSGMEHQMISIQTRRARQNRQLAAARAHASVEWTSPPTTRGPIV
jgi:hypothetical protein